jgi:hypothetical protein
MSTPLSNGSIFIAFQLIPVTAKPWIVPKKNPDLHGRDFFLLLPSSLATQGQDLRIYHSLAALTRHPGHNEQKNPAFSWPLRHKALNRWP